MTKTMLVAIINHELLNVFFWFLIINTICNIIWILSLLQSLEIKLKGTKSFLLIFQWKRTEDNYTIILQKIWAIYNNWHLKFNVDKLPFRSWVWNWLVFYSIWTIITLFQGWSILRAPVNIKSVTDVTSTSIMTVMN